MGRLSRAVKPALADSAGDRRASGARYDTTGSASGDGPVHPRHAELCQRQRQAFPDRIEGAEEAHLLVGVEELELDARVGAGEQADEALRLLLMIFSTIFLARADKR